MGKRVEILCVTTVIIAIILIALGASMYDKSDKPSYESNSHNEFIGYIIILVGVGFLCVSVIICCAIMIRQYVIPHVRSTYGMINDIEQQ